MGLSLRFITFATVAALSAWGMAGCGKHNATTTNAPPGASKPIATVTNKATSGQPFENSLGMKFVPVPGLNSLFSIWETRVQDYQEFLKGVGVAISPAVSKRATYPVNNVSWEEAAAFCDWLTVRERELGRIGPKDRYRLPRDREWDIALGTKERYPWGDKWPKGNERSRLPGYLPDSQNLLAPVGSSPANAFGIYDLSGNAMEWCLDSYDRDMNTREMRVEYKRLEDDRGGNKFKILRGNSWLFFDPVNLLTSYRYPNLPDARGTLYGFRCVVEFNSLATVKQHQPPHPLSELPPLNATLNSGRDLYLGRCGECHQYFDPASYSNEEWGMWMDKMRGKAKMNNREYEETAQFLKVIRGQ